MINFLNLNKGMLKKCLARNSAQIKCKQYNKKIYDLFLHDEHLDYSFGTRTKLKQNAWKGMIDDSSSSPNDFNLFSLKITQPKTPTQVERKLREKNLLKNIVVKKQYF